MSSCCRPTINPCADKCCPPHIFPLAPNDKYPNGPPDCTSPFYVNILNRFKPIFYIWSGGVLGWIEFQAGATVGTASSNLPYLFASNNVGGDPPPFNQLFADTLGSFDALPAQIFSATSIGTLTKVDAGSPYYNPLRFTPTIPGIFSITINTEYFYFSFGNDKVQLGLLEVGTNFPIATQQIFLNDATLEAQLKSPISVTFTEIINNPIDITIKPLGLTSGQAHTEFTSVNIVRLNDFT